MIDRSALWLSLWLAVAPGGALGAGPDPPVEGPAPLPIRCPTVDRGSPTDGVTTVSVISPTAPCTSGPRWSGWSCMTLQSDANVNNGVSYQVEVRWNRQGLPVRGTFTWLDGGPSTKFLRDLPGGFADSTQNQLDLDQVRTIEMRFLGSGTETSPANGFPNVSSVYADVLEFLVTQGIATGVLGHFGNSGGAMIGANALAYHKVDRLLRGMVFGGGPFWADLEGTCTDPSSPYYADAYTRSRADTLSWLDIEGTTPCALGDPAPFPSYQCRSTLGAEAQVDYPNTYLAVVVGTMDHNNPWLDSSAQDYLARVSALNKTFDRPATVHNVLSLQPGADAVLMRIREIVDAFAGAPRSTAGAGSPRAISLQVPAPNPATHGTLFSFTLANRGPVLLTVHDVAGRRVATLLDTPLSAGRHTARWTGRDSAGRRVAAGTYFVRLSSPEDQEIRKVQLLR